MIVYHSDKSGFMRDVETGDIDGIILQNFRKVRGFGVGDSEVRSWRESLTQMHLVLVDEGIPADSGVSVELQIPQTAKRIDFILSGQDELRADRAVIIELKQWETATRTAMDGLVETFVGGGIRQVSHPSYQAWSYAQLLRDFNEAIYEGDIDLHPCAYLHNFRGPAELADPFYAPYLDRAPLFLKGEVEKLRAFIRKYVRYGDRSEIIFRIERGKIRPSKQLAESIAALMKGKSEFTLIDDQKVAFERALHLARTTPEEEKCVLLVHGGPGTGKTLVAINLLVALIEGRETAAYVTKNAAPRAVFEAQLTGTMTKSRYSNLFMGSGAFVTAEPRQFHTLIVDEAHRLNEKSGLYQNLGENQVEELIRASGVTVFFLDEDQRVTLKDIGSRGEIMRAAKELGATVEEITLESQFRCNGSDGYLTWLDHILQIRPTARIDLEGIDYDFRVCASPNELRERIEERNATNNRSRMVAGYCWPWRSKEDASAFDVEIPEHDFQMRWNLRQDGSLWILKPDSVREIGCIHTCQGLELEYVGVIIGEDLVVRDGMVVVQPEKRDRYDSTIRGYRKMLREDPKRAQTEARAIVLNTYRTLMTRGMKGCYVYCVDGVTQKYFEDVANGEAPGPAIDSSLGWKG